MEIPGEIRNLVDKLGQAMVRAVMADEVGRGLIQQIQDTGFDVGVLLEASVALHPKDSENCNGSCEKTSEMPNPFKEADPDKRGSSYDYAWSEQDKALMCSFRISLE
ncbi:MAG: hypothetical protein LBB40_04510 [Holophagales bacterium]|jgi:hypothetical protein|nr:hypothetical protein [Holophagales bacterium]